jgi:hypothetical protein
MWKKNRLKDFPNSLAQLPLRRFQFMINPFEDEKIKFYEKKFGDYSFETIASYVLIYLRKREEKEKEAYKKRCRREEKDLKEIQGGFLIDLR